jgi:PQQ-like domain
MNVFDRPTTSPETSYRRNFILAVFMLVLLLLTGVLGSRRWPQTSPVERTTQEVKEPPGSIGIWQSQSGVPFRYDGDNVHLHIIRMHPWEKSPEDNVYRLKARWKGNTLYYLETWGRWQRLATFENGRFVNLSKEGGCVYEKVTKSKLKEFDAALANDRPMWSYPLTERSLPIQLIREWMNNPGANQPILPCLVLHEISDEATQLEVDPVGVAKLAYSPDGRRLVAFTSGWDAVNEKNVGYAKIWDAVSGKAEGSLQHLPAIVWAAAFSPDGASLALADDEGTVRVWDALKRNELYHRKNHAAAALCVAFSPDNKLLASGGKDGTVLVRTVATGKQEWNLKCHGDALKSVAFSPDGKHLLSACSEEGVRVWSLETGKEERALTAPGKFCTAAFDIEGKRAAIGGWGEVRAWDLDTGKPIGRYSRKDALVHRVSGIAFSPDGLLLVSGGEQGDIKCWEVATGRMLFTIRGYRGDVRGLVFSPDNRFLATCGRKESIEVWNVAALLEKQGLHHPLGREAGWPDSFPIPISWEPVRK